MSKERNLTVEVKCYQCGETFELKVAFDDWQEYVSDVRRHIQDIFPYLTSAERELLISNTCEKCWNDMFNADLD